jgi:hypothetical protein
MKKTQGFLIVSMMSLAIGFVIALASCNKPSATAPILPGNEFLTTTLLVITDPINGTADTVIWSELPNQTMPDTLRSFVTLKQQHTYHLQVIILDSTKVVNGVITDTAGFVVSNEIIARQNYHLFCFYDYSNQNDIYGTPYSSRASSGWANVSVNNPNYDLNNPPLPFGMTDNLITYGPTSGQLEVKLKHQPDVKNGQCSPGSTDLDVYYNITVQ